MYDSYAAWMRAGIDAWSLGVKSSEVVALRLGRIAAGGDVASAEAMLMVTEKMEAAFEMQVALMTGALGATPLQASRKAIRHYDRKVAANRRRLSCRP